jgi:3-oxoacyl-[acyl-carrier protein] reductase
MSSSIEERAVLVTGGSKGLGLEIVRCLLDSGYPVAACSRSLSADLERVVAGVPTERCAWIPCDVGNEASELAMIEAFTSWLEDRPW